MMRLCKRQPVLSVLIATFFLTGTFAWGGAGDTELREAAERGDLSRVNALLAAKANVNAKTTDGDTALVLAKKKGHDEAARLLENR